ncbi:MAG: hypothetical protein QM622_01840 [Microbacterium sp.]
MLTVTARSGIRLTAGAGARSARGHDLAVMPIWCQADLDEPSRTLEALGLRRRLSSDSGTIDDLYGYRRGG